MKHQNPRSGIHTSRRRANRAPAGDADSSQPQDIHRPAKLSRPAGNLVPRPRLFDLLENLRRASAATWIAAPAGAGKTSLAVSYATSSGRPTLWYRQDPGDRNPALLCEGLTQAAILACHQRLDLPPYHTQVKAAEFARLFFRDFYRFILPDTLLVLDDCHETISEPAVCLLLRAAVEEAAPGCQVLFLSRGYPPRELSPLLLSGRMQILEEQTLCFDRPEAEALCQHADSSPATETLDLWLERTQGWAAGLVLLNRFGQHQDGTETMPPDRLPARETLFEYFSTELFNRRAPEVQTFLLTTAWLPVVEQRCAQSLTGRDDVRQIIDALVRECCFITRHEQAGGSSYRYHPLCRGFLQDCGRRRFTPAQLRGLQVRVAERLQAEGNFHDSIPIYLELGDWERALAALNRIAQDYVDQGRERTLLAWLDRFPAPPARQSPWLSYWRALCVQQNRPDLALELLQHASAGFARENDVTGRYLAWADTVMTSAVIRLFGPQAEMLQTLDSLQKIHPQIGPPEVEAQVVAAAFWAAFYSALPAWRLWRKRLEALLQQPLPPARRALMALLLVEAELRTGEDADRLESLVTRLQDWLARDQVPPEVAASCAGVMSAHSIYRSTETENVLPGLQTWLERTRKGGLVFSAFFMQLRLAEWHLTEGAAQEAEDALTAVRPLVETFPEWVRVMFHAISAWQACESGRLQRAREHARIALLPRFR